MTDPKILLAKEKIVILGYATNEVNGYLVIPFAFALEKLILHSGEK